MDEEKLAAGDGNNGRSTAVTKSWISGVFFSLARFIVNSPVNLYTFVARHFLQRLRLSSTTQMGHIENFSGNKTDDWGESVLQRVHMLERRISELEMRAGKIPNRPPVTFQTVAEATIHNSYELGGVVSEGKPQKSAAAANKRKPSQLPTTPIKAARKLPHLDTNILSGFGSASETAKDFTEPNTPNSPLGLKTSTLTPRSLQSAASRCKSSPRAKLPLKKAKQDYEALISSPNINRRISYGKPKADRMGRWKEPSIKRKKSKIIISKTASDKENSVP